MAFGIVSPSSLNQILASWLDWWRDLSLKQRLLPLFLLTVYWLALRAMGGFRSEHLVVGGVVAGFHYAGPLTRRVREFIMPLFWVGILYDGQRFYTPYLRSAVHVEEPYLWDLKYFGITVAERVLTPNEWWQRHTHPVLDFVAGCFYVSLLATFIAIAGYFGFVLGRKGTHRYASSELSSIGVRMMWGLFALNVIGFMTYCAYAAAPPWYVSDYGFGPARLDAPASAAGASRFDQLLGVQVFAGIYAQSSNVFGAIPSLHIAYPMLATFYAFRVGRLRGASIIYLLGMSFSAVYLNHHYVLDVLLGALYGLVVGVAAEIYVRLRRTSAKNIATM